MHLRDRAQIDGEGEHDLLTLAQTQISGLNKNAGGAQIDCLAKPSAALRHGDIDGCTCTVPRMQAAFHSRPLTHVGSSLLYDPSDHSMPRDDPAAGATRLNFLIVIGATDWAPDLGRRT